VEKAHFPVTELCRVLEVSRSGYYAWRQREPDPARQDKLVRTVRRAVKAIHQQKRGSYGSRRMAKALQREGWSVGRHQARGLRGPT
jgi:putative transposase